MDYEIYADRVSWGAQQILDWTEKTITPLQLKKSTVRIFLTQPHGSGMYEIPCCVVLQLLPLMFTPELAQTLTACPLGHGLTQLLPAAPLQTGPWLSYTTPGELPLSCSISPCVPSGWRKMYSLPGCCCHRHLNSNHSSFLLRPPRFGRPHDWKRAVVKSAEGKVSL